jgi:integrase
MPSKSGQSRSRKGSISIKNSNGSLQLVFSHSVITPTGEIKSKRFYLSTGQEDTPLGRQQASALAAKVQRDIDYEEFDASLVKYKPATALATVTPSPETLPEVSLLPNLTELWERYTHYKKTQISQSTLAKDYRRYRNHIAKLPTKELDDAISIRDHLVANLSKNAAKRTLTNISACCDWAIGSKLIEFNPFIGFSRSVKQPKSEDADEMDINPLTPKERDEIIQAFENSKLYSYYAPLVKFLFFTGCRPSEAIALQWKHVSNHVIYLEQAVTISPEGLALKEGLKTQPSRRFPINGQLKQILNSIKPEYWQPDDFLFTSKKGGFIDFGDFLSHAWKGHKNHRI